MRTYNADSYQYSAEWQNVSHIFNSTLINATDEYQENRNEGSLRVRPHEYLDSFNDQNEEIRDIGGKNEQYDVPTWMYVVTPSLFNWVPLCVLLVSYCMIWVKIKRSNVRIEGMVAFNKHKNEVITLMHI